MDVCDNRSLKLNIGFNAIKGMMGVIFPLITFPYVSNILGVENIGRYSFAMTIVSYFILFSQLGISNYAIRECSHFREDKVQLQKLVSELFSFNMITTVLSYAILLICLSCVSKLSNYKDLLLIFSVQILFTTIGVEWIFSVFEDYKYIAIRSIIFQFLSLILLFMFVRNESDIYVYAAITVFAAVGSNLVNYIKANRYCKLSFVHKMNLREHLSPILVFFASNLTIIIYAASGVTILGFLSNDFQVGLFTVSNKIYTVVKTILSSVIVVSIPRLSALVTNEGSRNFDSVASDVYRTLLSVLLPVTVGIWILKKEIVLLISSVDFLDAEYSLGILSIALVCCLGAWFWGQCILVPQKKENLLLKITIVSAIVNIIVNFSFVPYWHSVAAAMAVLCGEGIALICSYHYGKKLVHVDNAWECFFKVGIGCIPMTILYYVVKVYVANLYALVISMIVVSPVIYCLVEYYLKNPVICGAVRDLRNRCFE